MVHGLYILINQGPPGGGEFILLIKHSAKGFSLIWKVIEIIGELFEFFFGIIIDPSDSIKPAK